jgi:hypothetical protein
MVVAAHFFGEPEALSGEFFLPFSFLIRNSFGISTGGDKLGFPFDFFS